MKQNCQDDLDKDNTAACVPVGTPNPILTAKDHFKNFGSTLPKQVCQHPFKRNDIVWVCRTCQADETCVLCHACFNASDHENHDVAFYHAQAGVIQMRGIQLDSVLFMGKIWTLFWKRVWSVG